MTGVAVAQRAKGIENRIKHGDESLGSCVLQNCAIELPAYFCGLQTSLGQCMDARLDVGHKQCGPQSLARNVGDTEGGRQIAQPYRVEIVSSDFLCGAPIGIEMAAGKIRQFQREEPSLDLVGVLDLSFLLALDTSFFDLAADRCEQLPVIPRLLHEVPATVL